MQREVKIIKIFNDNDGHFELNKEGFIEINDTHTSLDFVFKGKDNVIIYSEGILAVRKLPNYMLVITKSNTYILQYIGYIKTFYELYKNNEIDMNEISYFKEEWFNSKYSPSDIEFDNSLYKYLNLDELFIQELFKDNKKVELYEYLGLTENQYERYTKEGIIE